MSLTCKIEYRGDYFATVLTIDSDNNIQTSSTAVEIQAQDGTTHMIPLDVVHTITIKRKGA